MSGMNSWGSYGGDCLCRECTSPEPEAEMASRKTTECCRCGAETEDEDFGPEQLCNICFEDLEAKFGPAVAALLSDPKIVEAIVAYEDEK